MNIGVLLLIAQEVQDGHDKQRTEILNVEHVVPSDLFAEIFEGQLIGLGDFRKSQGELIVGEDDFFVIGFERKFLLDEGNFG